MNYNKFKNVGVLFQKIGLKSTEVNKELIGFILYKVMLLI